MSSNRLVIPRVDGIGSILMVAGLCIFAWFGPLKADSAAVELEQIRSAQLEMQTEHSRMQKAIGRNVAEWRSLKEKAQREGKLDEQLPVQERLRAIRELAGQHGWRDVHIMPVQWRSAVDVAEQTFSISATVSYYQLLSFFQAFERSDTWADISHLAIKPLLKEQSGEQQCQLELTLNFYSSYVPDRAAS